MFKKILIANRGEIACRIIKTARQMGIATIAVYSEADADALHVELADEAVLLGPPPVSESYLVVEKIIEAAQDSGAEAVHPGYGFLSENAGFAEALAAQGIAFIGPNVAAIRVMGDKIESKKFARGAKVNTVPGHLSTIADTDEAIKIAKDVGYPVMIKASAGGGGKGMRIAHNDDDVALGFDSARNEARSSFGDDRVFIEKYIVEPRHIEIQILGDKHGNIIHLGERECSIQRRNQKIIEEAPSPFVDKKMRKAMGEQAIVLARAVNYESAGTVEFIVDKNKNFFFLEMNTRIQVEHPVTELVTGIDLVEQMIRVAAGEKLSLKQSDIKIDGWAIEGRIYAEDPYRNFLPSIGRLVYYRPPEDSKQSGLTIRNDTGVTEGSEISLFYDPMIAKLCAHGPSRDAAIDLMTEALDTFYIQGIDHNISFLSAVMGQKRFRDGQLNTNYIEQAFPDGFHGAVLEPHEIDRMIAMAVFAHGKEVSRAYGISGRLHETLRTVNGDWVVRFGDENYSVILQMTGAGADVVIGPSEGGDGSRRMSVESLWHPGEPVLRAKINGASFVAQIRPATEGWFLSHRGARVKVVVRTKRAAELAVLLPVKSVADTSKYLLCPMPGLVVSIGVEVGQEVKVGEPLAVVEAMKMENVLTAQRDAVIGKVVVMPGDSLSVDDVILEFE